MMRGLFLALVTAAAAAAPASGVGVEAAASGGIDVEPSFSACAWVEFPGSGTFVGEFSAVGVLEGPGTTISTVRSSTPFVATGSWSGCINGGHDGATVGDAKFTLNAHSATGDYVEVKQCVVNHGALTCV